MESEVGYPSDFHIGTASFFERSQILQNSMPELGWGKASDNNSDLVEENIKNLILDIQPQSKYEGIKPTPQYIYKTNKIPECDSHIISQIKI